MVRWAANDGGELGLNVVQGWQRPFSGGVDRGGLCGGGGDGDGLVEGGVEGGDVIGGGGVIGDGEGELRGGVPVEHTGEQTIKRAYTYWHRVAKHLAELPLLAL